MRGRFCCFQLYNLTVSATLFSSQTFGLGTTKPVATPQNGASVSSGQKLGQPNYQPSLAPLSQAPQLTNYSQNSPGITMNTSLQSSGFGIQSTGSLGMVSSQTRSPMVLGNHQNGGMGTWNPSWSSPLFANQLSQPMSQQKPKPLSAAEINDLLS